MRIVALSDTHGNHEALDVPEGDVLVHAGDFCEEGDATEAQFFLRWWEKLPHTEKILVAGNHDRCFEHDTAERPGLVHYADQIGHYLEDESITINDITFYGSPWTPEFQNWGFMKDRGSALKSVWNKIDNKTDVLITHGPPYGVLDKAPKSAAGATMMGAHQPAGTIKKSVGDRELGKALKRVRPKHHIFGHIHEGRGSRQYEGTHCYNVTVMDGSYEPSHDPAVITVESG